MNIKDHKRIILLGITLILMCILSFAIEPVLNPPWESISQDHGPSQLSNFELAWLQEDVYMTSSYQAVFLALGKENIFMYGSLGRYKNASLLGLDWNTREIQWQHPAGNTLTGAVNNIAANSRIVYVGFDGTGKTIDNSTEGAGRIIAYDLQTGSKVWIRPIPGARRIHSIAANEFAISVDGRSVSRRYYLLDADTGNIIDTFEKGESWDDNHFFSMTNYGVLFNAFPTNDNNLADEHFWARTFKADKVYRPPARHNSIVIMQQVEGSRSKGLQTVSEKTRSILWQVNMDTISNLAINESAVFFVTSEANLVALDLETGEMVGFVEFSDQLEEGENYGFYVAANNDHVLVYLGDARKLFAFRFLPNSSDS